MMALVAGQSLVILVAGAIYFRGAGLLPFAYGVLIALAANCVKAYLVGRTAEKMEAGQCGPGAYSGQFFIRVALTGLVLVLAARSVHINFFGAVAGIVTWHPATHMLRYFIERDNAKLEKEADA